MQKIINNNMENFSQHESPQDVIDKIRVEDLVPTSRMEDLLGVELEHHVTKGEDIEFLLNEKGDCAFNRPIEKSMTRMVLSGGIDFSDELEIEAYRRGFYLRVEEAIESENESRCWGDEMPEMPKSQIFFRGILPGSDPSLQSSYVYKLHLAEILSNGTNDDRDLYIDYIFLSNPIAAKEQGIERMSLGNGIFDEILRRIESYARIEGFLTICLEAEGPQQRDTFLRRGYEIEEGPLARSAEERQAGFPMRKELSAAREGLY